MGDVDVDQIPRWRQGRSDDSVARRNEALKARQKAMTRLSRRHPEEFAALYADERAKRDVPAGRSTSGECADCGLKIDSGDKCEFCEEWADRG